MGNAEGLKKLMQVFLNRSRPELRTTRKIAIYVVAGFISLTVDY